MSGRMRILGIPIDRLTRAEVLARCAAALKDARLYWIVTANPEILLEAREHPEYRQEIQQADLVVPDGVGVILALRLLLAPLPERVPGVELLEDLCVLAAREGKRVAFLGGRGGVAEAAAARLRSRIPGLQVRAYADEYAASELPVGLWEELRALGPALLFVAYGAPGQERWIAEHRDPLQSLGVRVAMGVGGAFDMLAGRLPRAPRALRAAGLEWLWRLALEPRRLPRIFRATFIFALVVLRDRFRW